MATYSPAGRSGSVEGRSFHIHIYNPDGMLRVEGNKRTYNGNVVFDGIVVSQDKLEAQMVKTLEWILGESGRAGTVYGPNCSKFTIFSNYKEKFAGRGWVLEGYEPKNAPQTSEIPWES